jgi:phosphoribosylaminoimidazolecarboxamide formyltransferase/IMP cyclohydrolase
VNQEKIQIKRALISVSNKEGIVELAQALTQQNIEIISTGGTSKLLREANIPVRDVADLTGFPELMDGRVKTLHPKIHGGILGLRDVHADTAAQYEISWIDLVVVNLYPFEQVIQKADVSFDEAIENIDIGGPTMIRSAAKNMGWTSVVVDPEDYMKIVEELQQSQAISFETRKVLAIKAFAHTAKYDAHIHHYFTQSGQFPSTLNIHLEKNTDLRYGENPHQAASAYQYAQHTTGILSAKQHQGKSLSYNNIADADAALVCVREFTQPACVIVKHANPCGVAVASDISAAFHQALVADSVSAFGGIVALNRLCDEKTAEAITAIFLEVLLAPAYTPGALKILENKPNLRVLELRGLEQLHTAQDFKFIHGGLLLQDKDSHQLDAENLKVVTTLQPSVTDIEAMLFAWRVIKHIKSNAILIAKENMTIGIGAGQVSRIDAVDMAIRKAGGKIVNAVLASDAFFPFRDSIDRLATMGIAAIIQPGGSLRDDEVIEACNQHGIAMLFTGVRCFKH